MLKCYFFFVLFFCVVCYTSNAQFVYKIKADSVKITNDSCTAELILENSTKNVNGFLYNRGNGRTEFKKAVTKINDSTYLIGADTIKTNGAAGWKLTGNGNTNPTFDFLGTIDSTKLLIKTNNKQAASVSADGTFTIGTSDTASRPNFRMFPNGDFLIGGPNRDYSAIDATYQNGIRFNRKFGYLEVGGTNNILDTTLSNQNFVGTTSGLIINNSNTNNLAGKLRASILSAYNVNLAANKLIYYSSLSGGSFFISDTLAHSIVSGNNHTISKFVNNSIITGNSQFVYERDIASGWFGFNNRSNASTYGNITGGNQNYIGSVGQLTVGLNLVNRSYAGTALGNKNVDFTTLPYNSYDSVSVMNIQPGYLLFSLGNSQSKTTSTRSNALTVLYNGRTQINTTGFTNNLNQTAVTPKAALEVVSTTSGVLLPRLTTNQRDSIVAGDRHNGLLLYNSDVNRFQYYEGGSWRDIATGSSSNAVQPINDSIVINWDLSQGTTKSVTLKGNRMLNISNLSNGSRGEIIIKQDSTGMRTLTLPSNSYVENEGNGKLPLTPVAGGIDILSFLYDGTNYYWSHRKSYTATPKVARFNFNETAQNVPGWNDVSGNPHQAVRTAKDVATNIGVSSIATTKWGAFGSGTSSNILGEKDANPSFVFGAQVTSSYWFSATYTYSTSADCNLEINGLESGATYNLEILSSREDADVANPNRYMRVVCVDNTGTSSVENFDSKGNTANLINFYNKAPDSNGKILLFIGKKDPADANNPYGYINGLRITKL